MINTGSRELNVARIHNYLLGGKDNYEEDRQAGDHLLALVPGVRFAARANRRFLGRAVRFLVSEAGIGQFIEIGTGLPAAGHVHQVAHRLEPLSRVVYVDNDPVVVSHARALLCTTPVVCAIEGDVRNPAGILDHPEVRSRVDFGAPVAVVLTAVLQFIADEDNPHKLVSMLTAAMAQGSYLVVSHFMGDDIGPVAAGQVKELYTRATAPIVPRSRASIARFFDGLELVPPGIGNVAAWHAGMSPAEPGWTIFLGGVGRKP